ncbi:vitamin B12 dependent-methionine synthase activation domain-containing protein [Myxococcota bacterium]
MPRPIPEASEVLRSLKLEPDMAEIHRSLGYPPGRLPSTDLGLLTDRLIAHALQSLQPSGTYSLYPVQARSRHSLTLGNVTIVGEVAEHLASADRIAAFVITVGDAIGQLAHQSCAEGEVLSGWVYDAVGSWAAEAAASGLMDALSARLLPGQGLTLRYSPGYCGMDMAQQGPIFDLTQAQSIGVSLLPSWFMRPVKSISGLIGLGSETSSHSRHSPCDHCLQVKCHMRRESQNPEGRA